MTSPRVAAVVVTHNREALLTACLAALAQGRTTPELVIVIDNASTDGTAAFLQAWRELPLRVVTLPQNTGGAGGFARGMQEAYASGCDWLWLMDDDCIVQPDALAALLEALARWQDDPPMVLASQVVWSDGSLHPLNLVTIASQDPARLQEAVCRRTLPIRAANFVSLLVHREAPARFGLPMARYFLWLDDVEWSARVLRQARGVLVPASTVEHRTPAPTATVDAVPARFFLHVRNGLWMLLWSRAFAPREALLRLAAWGLSCLCFLRRRWWQPRAYVAVARGIVLGLLPPGAPPPLVPAGPPARPSP